MNLGRTLRDAVVLSYHFQEEEEALEQDSCYWCGEDRARGQHVTVKWPAGVCRGASWILCLRHGGAERPEGAGSGDHVLQRRLGLREKHGFE